MNSFAVVAFFACLAATNAGLYHGSSAQILQGPSSRTTLVGPEGSVISAVAPGGQIVHEEHPGVVAHTAPVYAHAAPAVAYASHSVAHHVPVVAHAAHALAYSAHATPVVHAAHGAHSTVVTHSSAYGHENTIVAGPSGTISTGHAAHVAPVVSYAAPAVAHAAQYVAHASPVVYAAHGHEGQYVHDHSENLYDDGSYKPNLYHY